MILRLVDLLCRWYGVVAAAWLWHWLSLHYGASVEDPAAVLQLRVTSAAGLAAIYGLLLNVQSRRMDAAALLVGRWNVPEFRAQRHDFGEILDGKVALLSPEDVNFGEQRRTIVTVLNLFEEVGLSVRRGRAEESFLREYYAAVLIRAVCVFSRWIEQRRNELDDEDAFEHLQWLACRWQRRETFLKWPKAVRRRLKKTYGALLQGIGLGHPDCGC